MARISVQEKEWRAQEDAHTLAAADEIKNDPSRLKSAQTAASKMANEQQKRANSMKKVASSAKTRKPAVKSTVKTKQNTRIPGKKK